jgi:EAL domain-containing protein (putative c-di-GMP-specific phosphodiesterase class I)/GGDEF domain-containing protein
MDMWSTKIKALIKSRVLRVCLLMAAPFGLLLADRMTGELGLVLGAICVSAAIGFSSVTLGQHHNSAENKTKMTADAFVGLLHNRQTAKLPNETHCICLAVEIDDFAGLSERLGTQSLGLFDAELTHRLQSKVRGLDCLGQIEDHRFALGIMSTRHPDTETLLELARRVQRTISEKVWLDNSNHYVTCSVGFAHAPITAFVDDVFNKSLLALTEAQRNGPSAIRAYSPGFVGVHRSSKFSKAELTDALTNGDIQPWFQPQVSTDTGRIHGFEALVRWVQSNGTVLSPGEFLPDLEAVGLIERLGQQMLTGALKALRDWDRRGFNVQTVGVNLSSYELQNPKLVTDITWDLDRYEIAPERVTFEILETVIAETDEDIIVRNIAQLAKLGCLVDLDDFGTGHASITSIRRFAVNRLKIDRSFVMRCDHDPQQQQLLAAITSMADRLGLETLAEGVETRAEHAMLAQLGCGYVQGFGIGRPMPFEQTVEWLKTHQDAHTDIPEIPRRA